MEENQKMAANAAGKDEEKKIAEAAKAATELENSLKEPPAQPQEGEGALLLKKKYPKPEELQPKTAAPTDIPSKISLKDIPLPERMKGAEDASASLPKNAASFSRSAREVGIAPQSATERDMRVVSVAASHRTEIDEQGLPVIRTYAADMNREIKKKGATLTTIVGAERERAAREKIQPQKTTSSSRKWILIGGAILFVVVGAGAIGAAIFLTPKEELAPPEATLIYTNKQETIPLIDAPLTEELASMRARAALPLGEVEHFIVVQNDVLVSPQEVLLALGAPSGLARNATKVMVGVHSFNRNQPFIIVTTSFYDLSFQAMLSWEDTMAESLKDFFKPAGVTTPPPPLSFSDTIFKNIDVRQSGDAWPILYTFPTKDTLIITTNTNTLSEILTRLAAAAR